MKNSKLIKLLQTFPANMDVCILNLKKNEFHACAEPSSEGIHDEFEIHVMNSNDELKEIKKEFPNAKNFIALSFTERDREPISETEIESRAKLIANQCRMAGCTADFGDGIYQGVKLALEAENNVINE